MLLVGNEEVCKLLLLGLGHQLAILLLLLMVGCGRVVVAVALVLMIVGLGAVVVVVGCACVIGAVCIRVEQVLLLLLLLGEVVLVLLEEGIAGDCGGGCGRSLLLLVGAGRRVVGHGCGGSRRHRQVLRGAVGHCGGRHGRNEGPARGQPVQVGLVVLVLGAGSEQIAGRLAHQLLAPRRQVELVVLLLLLLLVLLLSSSCSSGGGGSSSGGRRRLVQTSQTEARRVLQRLVRAHWQVQVVRGRARVAGRGRAAEGRARGRRILALLAARFGGPRARARRIRVGVVVVVGAVSVS